MAKKQNSEKSSMICPDCDSSGYTKDKEGNSTKCKRCEGKGVIIYTKEKKK